MIEAELILGLCRRFTCIPDVAYAMDARVLRLLRIEELGGARTAEPEWEGGEM